MITCPNLLISGGSAGGKGSQDYSGSILALPLSIFTLSSALCVSFYAYAPAFHTNLACLKKFNDKNVWWDNKKNLLYKNDHKMFAYCEHHCNQSTLEYNDPRPRTPSKAAFAIQSRNSLPDQEVAGRLWHKRLGHAGPDAIEHLPQEVGGAKLRGPATID